MSDNKYTPKTIGKSKFSIPVYQRLFAWKEKEVRKLMEDLKYHFGHSSGKPYYIGMLTTINKNGIYDLIDGQQRFTVMTLMAIVLKEYYAEWGCFLQGGNRVKFVARTEDENYIKEKISGKESKDYINKDMECGIETIKKFMEEKFDSYTEKKTFAEKTYKNLTFFITELPSGYLDDGASLNNYFEVMNSSGRSLEQHEIIKVELMRNMPNQDHLTSIWNKVSMMDKPIIKRDSKENDEEYGNRYLDSIKGNYNIFEPIEREKQNYQSIDRIKPEKKEKNTFDLDDREDSIISFPELLLLTLDITMEIEKIKPKDFSEYQFYQKDKLKKTFDEFKDKIKDIPDFYERLLKIRLLLDYYIIRRDFADGQGNYSLIFSPKDNHENRAKLRQYQSMLYVSTDFYNWLKPYIKWLMDETPENSGLMLKKLKEIDEQFHGEKPEEKLMYPNIDRYWFWKLDYILWDRRDNIYQKNPKISKKDFMEVVNSYVFRENRSIEHLHPRDERQNEEWKEYDKNMFGNLAMISSSFNSTQSNDNVRVKFARIEEQIANKSLQSIKMLLMWMMAENNVWTEQNAKEHGNKMKEYLSDNVQTIQLYDKNLTLPLHKDWTLYNKFEYEDEIWLYSTKGKNTIEILQDSVSLSNITEDDQYIGSDYQDINQIFDFKTLQKSEFEYDNETYFCYSANYSTQEELNEIITEIYEKVN